MIHRRVFSLDKSAYHGMCTILCGLALAGCGDGDQRPQVASAAFTQGGGVSGGPLAGTLTVVAIDADSSEPIPGATVWLGSGQNAHQIGQAGGDGSLTVSGSGLGAGPQTVSVTAPGYAAATWALVQSAVVAIPLESAVSTTGTAQVTISLPGWADLPAPADGTYRIARFAFSRPRGLEALEAALTGAAPDCASTASTASCSATLSIPADSTSILALVAEGSDAGTPSDPSDDVLAMTRLGIQTGLSLQADSSVNVSLDLLDSSAIAEATLATVGDTPGQFEDVIGVPGISLDGQILLYPSLGPLATSFLVPTATGAFANAKLWAVATADDSSGAGWSRSYERGIDPPLDAHDTISLTTSTFVALPTLTKSAASSYTLSAAGNLERLEFSTPSGKALNALLFPTQGQFEIPAGLLDEEPNAVNVETFDLELDPSSFAFDDLSRQATRIAYAHIDSL